MLSHIKSNCKPKTSFFESKATLKSLLLCLASFKTASDAFKGFEPKVIQGGKGKTKPGSKIDYGKMEEFLGVKLRGDETFDELLEIEKRMKDKDPEDFAGGGLATMAHMTRPLDGTR